MTRSAHAMPELTAREAQVVVDALKVYVEEITNDGVTALVGARASDKVARAHLQAVHGLRSDLDKARARIHRLEARNRHLEAQLKHAEAEVTYLATGEDPDDQ